VRHKKWSRHSPATRRTAPVGIALRHGPGHGGAEVVELVPPETQVPFLVDQSEALEACCVLDAPVGVPAANLVELTGDRHLLGGVVAQRLEQPVPGVGSGQVGDDQ
jgi:hypothetical protein